MWLCFVWGVAGFVFSFMLAMTLGAHFYKRGK